MLTVSKNREQVCMSQFAGQAVRKLLKDPLGRQLRCKGVCDTNRYDKGDHGN